MGAPNGNQNAVGNKGGAPKGSRNALKGKRWRDALSTALFRYEDDKIKQGEALDKIAERVVIGALAGDKDCWEEIGNRLDGKAEQSIVAEIKHVRELSDDELLERIERVRSAGGTLEPQAGEENPSGVH